MADAITSFSTLALDVANVFIAAEQYENAERQRVLASMGRKEKLPQKNGKTLRLMRFKRFDLPVEPLREGIPPDAVPLITENVDITLDQWGIVGLITDVAEITVNHNALSMMNKRCGQAMSEMFERETARTLMAGGIVKYAGAATSRATLTGAVYAGTADVLFATVTLRALGAAPTGDSGVYMGVMPPQVEGDLTGSDTTFTQAAQQAQLRALQYAEIGVWQGVRWKRSNFLPYYQSVAAPTTAAATATKALYATATTGGVLATDNYLLTVVGRERTTDYERRVSIESANIAVTGATGSISVQLPTSTNYVYDIYMRDDGEAAAGTPSRLVTGATRLQGGSTFVITAEAPSGGVTPPAAVGDSAGDEVFVSFVFGEDAFFTVELNGMSLQSFITPPGPSWPNPLAQGRKVGSKAMWKCGIIDPNFYVRIESNSRYSAHLPA